MMKNVMYLQVYFEYTLPSNAPASVVRFDVIKYQGTVSFMAHINEAPLRLTFPFVSLNLPTDEEVTSVFACNVAPGEKVFLGARGGDHCSTFTVTPVVNESSAALSKCSEETNADLSVNYNEDDSVRLDEDIWNYGHCQRGGWSNIYFSVLIHRDMKPENILLELEDLGDDGAPGVLDPTAFSVYVFDGKPTVISKRTTAGAYRLLSSKSKNGIHPIILNYLEIKKIINTLIQNNASETTLSIAMKCSENRELVRFRGMRHSFHANSTMGHRHYGEVCPLGWVYHFVDLTHSFSDEKRRRLGSDSSDVDQRRLRFQLRILQGGIFQVSARLNHAPGFNSNNEVDLELMAGDDPDSTVARGHEIEYDIDLCQSPGHISYIGLFGDESGCALYEYEFVWIEDGKCMSGSQRVSSI